MATAPIGIPRIGDKAPDFKVMTTQGELSLYEWQGKDWVVLFSHPADFTPVCSTELTEFARRHADFTQRSTKLLAVSVDSIHSHMAWRENLKQLFKVDLNYPMVADNNAKVAELYGMIHPGTSNTATVRAVFVIDPKQIIRALIYYPMNVGRNIDEIIRLIDGLQTADTHTCATPVNWQPGEKVIVPAPKTVADLKERDSHKDYEKLSFYINLKKLP
jgi:peroxiredoxin (alkyl hydroperoxide reductase subunit C)